LSYPLAQTRFKNGIFMKRKDNFLRAIQLVRSRRSHDRRFAFGWALNLNEETIPPDVKLAARRFVIHLSR
jgi:hypothetical protein